LHWGSLWVEISTLAYELKSSCRPERLSGVDCTKKIKKKIVKKKKKNKKKKKMMFTATEGPTDTPLVVQG
jgi:hypothetical protein